MRRRILHRLICQAGVLGLWTRRAPWTRLYDRLSWLLLVAFSRLSLSWPLLVLRSGGGL